MIRIRNKEIRIKPTYDPSEEYSFGVYLSLIDKIKKILEKCILESEMPSTYYTLDEIASKMQKSPLKMKNAIKKLQDAGFVASPTSLNPTGFRTDCRIDEILKLLS